MREDGNRVCVEEVDYAGSGIFCPAILPDGRSAGACECGLPEEGFGDGGAACKEAGVVGEAVEKPGRVGIVGIRDEYGDRAYGASLPAGVGIEESGNGQAVRLNFVQEQGWEFSCAAECDLLVMILSGLQAECAYVFDHGYLAEEGCIHGVAVEQAAEDGAGQGGEAEEEAGDCLLFSGNEGIAFEGVIGGCDKVGKREYGCPECEVVDDVQGQDARNVASCRIAQVKNGGF